MKKQILSAAALAVIAAMTGCSSDDTLLSQQDEKLQGTNIPFSISATIADSELTRATDISSLSAYQLWATASDAEWWLKGETVLNGKIEGKTWGSTQTSTFRGISCGNSSTLSSDITQNVKEGTFTYEVPGAISKQTDLLAGTGTGTPTEASITFNHILAAIKSLKFKLNANLTGQNDAGRTYGFDVESITIHNLVNQGTYTFDDGTWNTESYTETDWANDAAKGDITIPVNQKFTYKVPSTSPSTVPQDEEGRNNAANIQTWAVTSLADYVYLMPQANIVKWAAGEGVTPTNAYISIKCKFYWYTEGEVVEEADEVEGGKCPSAAAMADDDYDSDDWDYLPADKGKQICETLVAGNSTNLVEDITYGTMLLPFKAAKLEANKGYNLTLNIVQTYTGDDVEQTFEGITYGEDN